MTPEEKEILAAIRREQEDALIAAIAAAEAARRAKEQRWLASLERDGGKRR